MDNMDCLEILESNNTTLTNQDNWEENPAFYYLANLSKTGRRVQAHALNLIANLLIPGSDYMTFPWHQLKYKHALLIKVTLQNQYKTSTLNRMLSALKGTMKQAWLLGQIPAEQYLRIKQVECVKRSELPAGRHINAEEIEAIMNVCIQDESPAGFRDAAIIAWMVSGGGPRRSEVVSMDLSDYDPVSGQIRIIGKGNKERTSYIENGAAEAMADWLAVRGDEPGPLFVPINRGGNMILRRMTSQAIYSMLKRRAKQAGVNKISPHDLRRTFISNMLEAGVDLATISQIVGHEDIKTTAIYDRRPEEAKKKATQLLNVPYKRRLA
jgi:site-specific recombinase XerD